MIDLNQIEGFDWDKGNLEKNWFKHKVSFLECEGVFNNNPVFFYDGTHSQKEDRYVVFGKNNQHRLLTIIFTLRNNKIRVISARDMNRKERQIYVREKTTR